MDNQILRRLTFACLNETAPYIEGLNLNELYTRTARTEEASEEFRAALEKTGLPFQLADPVDTARINAEMACEEQGFINGFRFAMKMMMEVQQ